MKKLLLLPIIASLGIAYEGCGLTKKDALNNLSQSIYVNINNQYQKKEKLTIGLFESFSKNVVNESSQTSNLTLKNVKYTQKNGKWCASVNKTDVQASAKDDLNFLLNFNLSQLPTNFNDKQKKINSLLAKISFVKGVLNNLKSSEIQKLTSLEKQLKDLSNVGEVIFNTNIPNATIKIAGKNKTYKPSQSILLPNGEYSYTISAPNRCPITGNFTIKAKQSFSINKDLLTYPVITFTSNQNSVNLLVDGKKEKINKPLTIKKCDGKAIWSMSFEDQIEKGEVSLKAGLKDTINQDFTPKLEMKKIKAKIQYYTHSKEVTINYGYAITTSDNKKQWDSEERIEVRQFNNYGIYKLGLGLLGGTQDKWTAKDMNELELAISARVQIPELADTTFHISKIPVIPYFGVEGGWDFYKFIDKGNYDTNDITSIFRGTIGSTFLLHKQFGFNIEYSKDFMEKRDYIFSMGLVMDF